MKEPMIQQSALSSSHLLSSSTGTSASANALSRALIDIRRGLGFKSARSFYLEYLQSRTRLDFNYSYYMKIEGGKIIPSPQVISTLSQGLEKDAADLLLLSYCEAIFPERAGLFRKSRKPAKPQAKATEAPNARTTAPSLNQKTLTPAQVACIARTRAHYHAFLILILAREAVSRERLAEVLREKGIDSVIADLERHKLIRMEDGLIRSISNEMKFPAADSTQMKKLYEQVDLWNLTFHQDMKFDVVMQKMLLRRVSARYVSLIQSHCNLLVDLVRTSDEIEQEQNEDVVMLNISFQRGFLPG